MLFESLFRGPFPWDSKVPSAPLLAYGEDPLAAAVSSPELISKPILADLIRTFRQGCLEASPLEPRRAGFRVCLQRK